MMNASAATLTRRLACSKATTTTMATRLLVARNFSSARPHEHDKVRQNWKGISVPDPLVVDYWKAHASDRVAVEASTSQDIVVDYWKDHSDSHVPEATSSHPDGHRNYSTTTTTRGSSPQKASPKKPCSKGGRNIDYWAEHSDTHFTDYWEESGKTHF